MGLHFHLFRDLFSDSQFQHPEQLGGRYEGSIITYSNSATARIVHPLAGLSKYHVQL
jgi:hypothetical protein